MAQVFPLKGVRYNQKLIPDISLVITPPYDVISKEAQQAYYAKHPNNIIRLELNRETPEDTPENNKYTRAASFFTQWLKEGILLPEHKEAIYLYQQKYEIFGETKIRTGVICRLQTEDYSKGTVLPHEETLPKHKEDRLILMRHTHANFSPIFGLFADKEKNIDSLLLSAVDLNNPDIAVTDEFGEEHYVWVITNAEVINKFQQLFSTKKVFIADGHHRYETALNFGKEMQAQGKKGYDKVLINLVNLYDEGLIVLPTHRLIKNLPEFKKQDFLKALEKNFDLTPLPVDVKNILTTMENEQSQTTFAVYLGEECIYLAKLKSEINLNTFLVESKCLAWKKLDVTVLTYLILENILKIDSKKRASGEYITYTRDADEALRFVQNGSHQIALMMNATKVEEVTEVALAGEKMPQKSTYFYPKVISGLVINKLDI